MCNMSVYFAASADITVYFIILYHVFSHLFKNVLKHVVKSVRDLSCEYLKSVMNELFAKILYLIYCLCL